MSNSHWVPQGKKYVYYMKMNIISNIGMDSIHNKFSELVDANFIWSNNLHPNGFTSLDFVTLRSPKQRFFSFGEILPICEIQQ